MRFPITLAVLLAVLSYQMHLIPQVVSKGRRMILYVVGPLGVWLAILASVPA